LFLKFQSLSLNAAIRLAAGSELSLIPYENEAVTGLKTAIHNKRVRDVSIMIGPEGGFSESEIKSAKTQGILSVTLGPRILRTETAGIAVISAIMYEIGDFGN
jgi:16S rRNA (uracil1498-N3)-methyltransferase